ncbi:MAG: ATP-binding protein [Candidatus Falkowbacteria bacterium]
MENNLILKEIERQNGHWKNDHSFFSAQEYQRKLFEDLVKYLPEQQILSIIGLRRTGKTTIIKQIIKYLIINNVDPINILFISFDEALITSKLSLVNYIDSYLTKTNASNKQKYIFLDEIQYVDKWQHILKRYYDVDKKIKFIVSGSSSLFIQKKTTESLAGRIYEFQLDHLMFEEFLEMSGAQKQLTEQYKKFVVSDFNQIKHSENEYQLFLTKYGAKLEKLFENYLLYYQFPETVFQTNRKIMYKYITDAIYKKSIEYDIPRLFDIDKVDELKFIFQILINETSSEIEYTKISSEAGIELNTLKKYLRYFHQSLLFDVVYNYSKSFRKSRRLQKKGYVASSNFFTAFHPELFESKTIASQYMGKLAETYVYNILKTKFQYISFYKKQNQEIDFICNNEYLNKREAKLVEVKYINNIKKEDFSFIEKIAKNIFKTSKYYILSKKHFLNNNNKTIIPCFLIK